MRRQLLTTGAVTGLFLVLLPVGATGQRCQPDTSPDHDDWHAEVRAGQDLRDAIEAAAAERGFELTGTISVDSDTAPPRTEIKYTDGFTAPASFIPVIRGHLSAYLLDLPLAEREVDLYFDRPKTPLWPDSTRICDPRAVNDDEIRRRLRDVIANHPDYRNGTLFARKYRASLRLFINWRGDVTRVRVQKPTMDDWLDVHLDEIGRAMTFEPATRNGVPIGVWVSRNVTFNVGEVPRESQIGPDRPPG